MRGIGGTKWAAGVAGAVVLLAACGPDQVAEETGSRGEPARKAVLADFSAAADEAGLGSAPQLDLPHQQQMRAATGQCIAAWDSRVEADEATVDRLAAELLRRGWTAGAETAPGQWERTGSARFQDLSMGDWQLEVTHVTAPGEGRVSLIATQTSRECERALTEAGENLRP